MRDIFALAVLATVIVACQPQSNSTVAAESAVIATQPASPVKSIHSLPTATDSLTSEMRDMLRQVDLTNLLLAPDPKQATGYQTVLDGFFGNNPQRLSLAILKATRDSLQPGLFYIVGKSRYKKQDAGFTGTIRIISVADYYDQGLLLTQGEASFVQDTTTGGNGTILNAKAYSASAAFHFTSKPPKTFELTGRALVDFWLTDKGKVGGLYAPCEGCADDKAPSRGSALLLRGKWLDTSAKSERPFIVCRDVFFISNNLIHDFGIGDRGAQVNPKYAKLGWTDYWENDEWWADSPKPSLSL